MLTLCTTLRQSATGAVTEPVHPDSEEYRPWEARVDFEPAPRAREVPASPASPPYPDLPRPPPPGFWFAPSLPEVSREGILPEPCDGLANIPLQETSNTMSVPTPDLASAIHTIMASTNICVLMIAMYISTWESSRTQFAHRKKLRRRGEGDGLTAAHHVAELDEDEDEPL